MKQIIGIAIMLVIVGGTIAVGIISIAIKHGAVAALTMVGLLALLLFGAWLATSDD
jgi:hypothetical protein